MLLRDWREGKRRALATIACGAVESRMDHPRLTGWGLLRAQSIAIGVSGDRSLEDDDGCADIFMGRACHQRRFPYRHVDDIGIELS